MKKEPMILALDAGTGDCRAIAFSADGRVMESAQMEWSYDARAAGIPGGYAFEPARCWADVKGLLHKVLSRLPDHQAKAVTVTSQRDGMVYLDRTGRELYCAPNMDLRGACVLQELEPDQEEILKRTGLPLHAMFGLPRLLWHKRYAAEAYEQIDCVMMLCDWLAWKLCGEKRSERAAAATSQMLNLETCRFDGELMRRLGLRDDLFPEVCQGTEPIGTLGEAAARETGLPAGTPVFIGGSDAHCGLVGMNCLQAGQTAVIAGTTTPILTLFDHPVRDPAGAVYATCTSVPGQWCLEGNADSTGLSLRWVRDLLAGAEAGSFSDLSAAAAEIAPGCDGMMAYIGVGIRGENRGRNYGGFVFPVPWNISDYKKAHFFRAALESNAFGVRANLEVLMEKGAARPQTLYVCGGQSRSALWDQILADTAGIPVQTYENPECTALGAAAQAAAGIGWYASLEEAAQAWARKGPLYLPGRDGAEQYQAIYKSWLQTHRQMIQW